MFWRLHSGENKGSRTLTCTHLHAQTCARTLPPSRPTAQSAPNVAVGPLGPIQSLWHPVEGTRIMNSERTNRKGCGSAHTQPPSPPATLRSSQHPWQPSSQRKPIQSGKLTVTQRLSLQTPAVTVGIAWVTDTVSCFPGTGSSCDRSGLGGGSHIPWWWPSLDKNRQVENFGASKAGGSKKLGLGQEAIYAQPLPWGGGGASLHLAKVRAGGRGQSRPSEL